MLREKRVTLVVINARLIGDLPCSSLLGRGQAVPVRKTPNPAQRQALLTPHKNRPRARVQLLNCNRRPIHRSGRSGWRKFENGSIQRLIQLDQRGSTHNYGVESGAGKSRYHLRVSLIDQHDKPVLRAHRLSERLCVLPRTDLNLPAQVVAPRTADARLRRRTGIKHTSSIRSQREANRPVNLGKRSQNMQRPTLPIRHRRQHEGTRDHPLTRRFSPTRVHPARISRICSGRAPTH